MRAERRRARDRRAAGGARHPPGETDASGHVHARRGRVPGRLRPRAGRSWSTTPGTSASRRRTRPHLSTTSEREGEAALSGCHHVVETAGRADSVMDPSPHRPRSRAELVHARLLSAARGYDALRKALAMKPDDVIEVVKASGLRGRGGAGFPTGMKWQFVDKKSTEPRYIVCNADESEPGTFKDHLLMERNPHLLIEGCAIACYAIGAKIAYIYIRGEFFHVQDVLERAIVEAYAKGFSARTSSARASTATCSCIGAPAPTRPGEETALLESLEGKRAQPRNKPPFPAVVGLYGSPTAVNNVETLCNVPLDRAERRRVVYRARSREERRAEAVLRQRPRQSAGRFRSLDGRHAARADRRQRGRRARRPDAQGGHPGRVVGADSAARSARHAGELRRDPEGRSLPARPAIIVLDDTTCMVWLAENLLHFYRHESCGKCTPCREGTDWLYKILHRIETRRRPDAGFRSAVEHLEQHRRQDALRVRRRRGHAGADDAEVFPARVPGARHEKGAARCRPSGARVNRLARTDMASR